MLNNKRVLTPIDFLPSVTAISHSKDILTDVHFCSDLFRHQELMPIFRYDCFGATKEGDALGAIYALEIPTWVTCHWKGNLLNTWSDAVSGEAVPGE